MLINIDGDNKQLLMNTKRNMGNFLLKEKQGSQNFVGVNVKIIKKEKYIFLKRQANSDVW